MRTEMYGFHRANFVTNVPLSVCKRFNVYPFSALSKALTDIALKPFDGFCAV